MADLARRDQIAGIDRGVLREVAIEKAKAKRKRDRALKKANPVFDPWPE